MRSVIVGDMHSFYDKKVETSSIQMMCVTEEREAPARCDRCAGADPVRCSDLFTLGGPGVVHREVAKVHS